MKRKDSYCLLRLLSIQLVSSPTLTGFAINGYPPISSSPLEEDSSFVITAVKNTMGMFLTVASILMREATSEPYISAIDRSSSIRSG